jgi:hypothetical protein
MFVFGHTGRIGGYGDEVAAQLHGVAILVVQGSISEYELIDVGGGPTAAKRDGKLLCHLGVAATQCELDVVPQLDLTFAGRNGFCSSATSRSKPCHYLFHGALNPCFTGSQVPISRRFGCLAALLATADDAQATSLIDRTFTLCRSVQLCGVSCMWPSIL